MKKNAFLRGERAFYFVWIDDAHIVIGILARLRHFVPTETLLMIYRSLILPYLSYGRCVWGLVAKSYINKLLVLQKRALRLIYFAPSNAHAILFFMETKGLFTWREEDPSTRKILEGGSS